MTTPDPHRDELAELMKDAILVLVGVVAVHRVDDVVVERIAAGLARVYERARGRLVDQRPTPQPALHPALARLLHLIDDTGDNR